MLGLLWRIDGSRVVVEGRWVLRGPPLMHPKCPLRLLQGLTLREDVVVRFGPL